MMQVSGGLRAFVKQQINDGKIGRKPEFVFKNLIIRLFQGGLFAFLGWISRRRSFSS